MVICVWVMMRVVVHAGFLGRIGGTIIAETPVSGLCALPGESGVADSFIGFASDSFDPAAGCEPRRQQFSRNR